MKLLFDKIFIAHLFIAIFSVVAVIVQISDAIDDTTMNMYKALCGLCCFVLAFIIGNCKLRGRILLYGGIMSALMAISIIYNGNARYVNLLWIWAYLGVTQLVFEYGASRLLSQIIVYLGCLYFIYNSLFGDMVSAEILGHGSANNVSILCIYLLSIYFLSLKRVENSLPYIPTLLILFISVWTANRSGIISAFIFFIFTFFINLKRSKTRKEKIVNYLVIGIIVTVAMYLSIRYIALIDEALMYKLDRQGMESARSILWKEYLNGCFDSLGNFLFGVPSNTPVYPNLRYYEGNPHNSFLMLHSKFGLWGFLFIILSLGRCFIKVIRKKDYIILGLLIIISVRAFFDWSAFPGLLDVLFWYFVLYNTFPKDQFSFK